MTHFQSPPTQDWPAAVRQLPPGALVKWVDNIQAAAEARAHNPAAYIVLRHWYDGRQTFNGSADWRTYEQSSRDFFQSFIDGTFLLGETAGVRHVDAVDAIEGWNEFTASSHTPAEEATRTASVEARARVWEQWRQSDERLNDIRLVIGNVAIGNDLPAAYARIATERDCLLGYHPYVPVLKPGAAAVQTFGPLALRQGATMREGDYYAPDSGYDVLMHQPLARRALETAGTGVLPNEWAFYSGRWSVMDAAFVAAGYRCDWIFTEAGPVGYGLNGSSVFLRANDGWQHPTVCGGDVGAMLDVVKYWLDKAAATPAWQQGRVVGGFGAFFTSHSGSDQWTTFQLRQPALTTFCEFLRDYTPPVPPPPDPEPQPTWNKTVVLLPQGTTREEYDAVTGEVGYPNKTEIAFSADAAFAPAALVNQHKVIVYDVLQWGGVDALEAWALARFGALPTIEYRDWPVSELFRFASWPTDYPGPDRINQAFGARPEYYAQFGLPGHEGVDLYATTGSGIYAVSYGEVYRIETVDNSNYGLQIRIDHGNGYKSIYAHLRRVDVGVGQMVYAGQRIGLADNTGNSSGDHLHFTLKRDGATAAGLTNYPHDQIDPTPYLMDLL